MGILSSMIMLVALISCIHSERRSESSALVSKIITPANLTLEEAVMRKSALSEIRYSVILDVTGENQVTGIAKSEFIWSGSKDVWLDFYAGEVHKVAVNGQAIQFNYDGYRIPLAKEFLKPGSNQIEINFSHDYSSNGRGLTRFVDPEDQQVYMHTKFEPFNANQLFPCFDQPDLKATYTIQVKAKNNWEVVAADYPKEIKPEGAFKLWTFPESAKFSTYLMSLHIGPYVIYKDKAGKIPLRLLIRKSLAKYVHPEEWFSSTRKGLKFFSDYFSTPYPFSKLDQIIAPAFSSGGMENVAAITYNESYVQRGMKTRLKRLRTANVIMHEIAHQWFGDLVTMKWWKDLWLNESFATYMADLALAQTTEFSEVWIDNADYKFSSMWQDTLSTTHPIENPISDVLQGAASFDGITYGKGGAVLRQLHFLIGDQAFRAGLKNYFSQFAWGNTVRADFIGSLAKASGQNLEAWQTEWLTTANRNTVTASFECKENLLQKVVIEQSAPDTHPTLRRHASQLALLKKKNQVLDTIKVLKVQFEGSKTEVPLNEKFACPDVIYPNADDYGYFKVSLDSVSLKEVLDSQNRVADPFIRKMLWLTLWQMVVDAELDFQVFGRLAIAALPMEKVESVQDSLVSYLSGGGSAGSILNYYFMAHRENSPEFQNLVHRINDLAWKRMQSSIPSERKLFWLNAGINSALESSALEKLKKLLTGELKIDHLPIEKDYRWAIIKRLVQTGEKDSQNFLARESVTDSGYTGRLNMLGATALIPNWESKQKLIDSLKSPKNQYTYEESRNIVAHLFPLSQLVLYQNYGEKFFADFNDVRRSRPPEEQELFTYLVPTVCASGYAKELTNYLKQESNLIPVAAKSLKMRADILNRCHRIVAKSLVEGK